MGQKADNTQRALLEKMKYVLYSKSNQDLNQDEIDDKLLDILHKHTEETWKGGYNSAVENIGIVIKSMKSE